MSDNHADLTDPELHESKGAAAAAINTVPVADGAGAAVFAKVPLAALATDVKGVGTVEQLYTLADVSTADFTLIPVLSARTLVTATVILHNAITTADSTMTFVNSVGPSTLGTKVIAFTASAEGTTFTFTPIVNNVFVANSYLKISTDGVSSAACRIEVLLKWTL